jgi:peptidoglycan/LPS O-acetylase OafA/YrhL
LYRLEELDSMRGMAALAVVLSHSINIIGTMPLYIEVSPLYFFRAAQEAVILFFVLSGFVLTLPFVNGKKFRYTPFIIKRISRIYLPYISAIFITFLICYLISDGPITNLGEWISHKWIVPIPINDIINHVLLIGNYETTTYNPVVWTLVHEMRISIIFPLILFFVIKLDWKKSIFIAFIISILVGIGNVYDINPSKGYKSSYILTLNYMFMFIVGGMLAKYKTEIVTFYNSKSTKYKIMFLLFSFGFYTYSRMLHLVPRKFNLTSIADFNFVLSNIGITIGAAGFIVIALSGGKITKFLNLKPLVITGKMSYSIYLYHTTILFLCFYLFNGRLSHWIIFIISILLITAVSLISWLYIEKYSTKLGYQISNSIQNIGNRTINTKYHKSAKRNL